MKDRFGNKLEIDDIVKVDLIKKGVPLLKGIVALNRQGNNLIAVNYYSIKGNLKIKYCTPYMVIKVKKQ